MKDCRASTCVKLKKQKNARLIFRRALLDYRPPASRLKSFIPAICKALLNDFKQGDTRG